MSQLKFYNLDEMCLVRETCPADAHLLRHAIEDARAQQRQPAAHREVLGNVHSSIQQSGDFISIVNIEVRSRKGAAKSFSY
ncbi:hypothetical protein [Acanthopleuribacter pedis]|uniref:Uncharacterized protein n=1 Tax=Acanthopleuribacter pedis TaxID=442870 RepID=A0A8J7QB98_9BACT|nr:hypothetical protein [Acanthopleuribacter pedis]MBO1322957.1 hypothetical protein [Acanthopleuribacter pedis]